MWAFTLIYFTVTNTQNNLVTHTVQTIQFANAESISRRKIICIVKIRHFLLLRVHPASGVRHDNS